MPKCDTCKASNGTVTKRPGGTKLCEGCYTKCKQNVLSRNDDVQTEKCENIMTVDACVVNNLLCYVKCKMSLLHHDLLVKVCVDKLSDQDKADAHALLHRLVQPVDRFQKRKGEDMAVRAMTDILKWLHEVDNTDLPYFVCDDVNVLPSVGVNDIDVSLLMKEMSLMRNENSNVKTLCENVVTEC